MTKKEEKFCHEYCIDLNGTKAAIRAGYSEKTAYSIGSRLLKKVEIADRIKKLQTDLEKTSEITKLRILEEHRRIAFSNIANLHRSWVELKDFEALSDEEKACVKSISTKVIKKNIGTKDEPAIVNVEYIRVELFDKVKALEDLSKLLGYDAPLRIDQSIDFSQLTDSQIQKIIDSFEI